MRFPYQLDIRNGGRAAPARDNLDISRRKILADGNALFATPRGVVHAVLTARAAGAKPASAQLYARRQSDVTPQDYQNAQIDAI